MRDCPAIQRAPYRCGECRDWRKVKTAAWREANRERWRLFERDGATQKRTKQALQ